MRPSKGIALALLLALPLTGRGQELTYASAKPAPASYTKLVWDYGGQLTVGYWYTAEQVQKIDLRIRYLEDKAAKECVEASVEGTKEALFGSTLLWVGIGVGVVAGIVGGYFIGQAAAK